jgi:flagellin
MGLTITNTNTLQLLSSLNRLSSQNSSTLQKLTTGFRINKGSDDPAGLIALQNLNAELTATDAAISSGQRANSLLGVADGALTEISSLLLDIESLAAASTNSAGLTQAEIAANQAQIDQAITSIDRIVQQTNFNGTKLLDGSQGIRTTRDATALTDTADVRIFSRRTQSTSDALAINVTTAARVASAVIANTASVSAANFAVQGKDGSATISVGAGEALTAVRDKIIAAAGQTGVSARVSGQRLIAVARQFGTDGFLSTSYIDGDADFTTVAYTAGVDAVATIAGQSVTADGLQFSFNQNGISGEFRLTTAGNAAGSAGTITVTTGGATFQLGTNSTTRATIGVDSLMSHKLGANGTGYLHELKSGGQYDVSKDPSKAVSIVREAISKVATAQGRIGGFQKFAVGSTLNSLEATKASLTEARGQIRDTDFATETAELSRQQVLLQSTISLLGVAGQQTSQILSLLR